MSEKTELHDPFIKYLKKKKLKFIRKNWNNHNRQVDDGHPDFIIFADYARVICIEFKTIKKFYTKDNGLNKKQLEWEKYLWNNGHCYAIAHDLEEAIKFVKDTIEDDYNNWLSGDC